MSIIAVEAPIIFGCITATVVGGGAIVGIFKWAHAQVVRDVEDRLKSTSADAATASRELTPNGGSSVKDAVDRIEAETFRQGKEIDGLSLKIEHHLGWHEGQSHGSGNGGQ